MNDYIQTLQELPPRYSSLLLEQLQSASVVATVGMRAMGMRLPDKENIPSRRDVYDHLVRLTNSALEAYHLTQQQAPPGTPPDGIWGEDEDECFWVEVTGRAEGYSVSVQFNLLYRGDA